MNATSPTARDGISIFRAVICFGLALAVTVYAAAILKELWRVVPPLDYRDTLWAHMLEFLFVVFLMALASAPFFGALLWFLARHAPKPPGILRWLAAGVVANLPIAAFSWLLGRTFDRIGGPFDWENVRGSLVILAFGLVAALAAWGMQHLRWAA